MEVVCVSNKVSSTGLLSLELKNKSQQNACIRTIQYKTQDLHQLLTYDNVRNNAELQAVQEGQRNGWRKEWFNKQQKQTKTNQNEANKMHKKITSQIQGDSQEKVLWINTQPSLGNPTYMHTHTHIQLP